MKKEIRIPVFNSQFLFQIRNEWVIEKDEPNMAWIDSNWEPEYQKEKEWSYDSIAERELFRVLRFNTCPFCKEKMYALFPIENLGLVYVCKNCFYWAGRGSRPFGVPNSRGNLGRLNIINNPDEVKLELLINHLSNNINDLYNLSPKQAEKILPNVLKDYLQCEVKAVGGVKDKGIDAIAIRGESEKILIQVKWRNRKNVAEGVSVVREVGGTLLARSIPNGIVISTRPKYSRDAIEESNLISSNEIVHIGRINLELKDFNDLIDMFEISSMIRKKDLALQDIIPYYNDGWDLFGTH